LKLLAAAAERLMASGYVYIGMDRFALPDDPLAVAQREGRLQWNCHGYTAHSDCDLVGLGLSAIGAVGPTYSQNAGTLSEYYARLEANDLPIVRGIQLTRDDLVRRNVIERFICHFEVSKEAVGVNYMLDFDRYFAAELDALRGLERDGLVEVEGDWIGVTPRGRLLVCAICRVFDRYRSAGGPAMAAVPARRSSRAD
jgi:oxygen-independent coproporphyrinogen-3 oxidase